MSVFPDPVLELHTTRSWDFLKENSGIFSHLPPSNDIIIGIVDTGMQLTFCLSPLKYYIFIICVYIYTRMYRLSNSFTSI